LPILWVGATPVFVDVADDVMVPTAQMIVAAITPRTRAILVVHIHGLAFDVPALRAALPGSRADITIVEDACQAHGTYLGGQHVGTLGPIGCFSLNAVKSLPAGQGGLIATNEDVLVERLRDLAGYGHTREGLHTNIGFCYGMPELTAAVARAQLSSLARHASRSRRNAALLSGVLADVDGVSTQVVHPDCVPSWHKYPVRLHPDVLIPGQTSKPGALRDLVVRSLSNQGVPASVWQSLPLPVHPLFGAQRANAFPTTTDLLANLFIVGDERHPLVAQSAATTKSWGSKLRRTLNETGLLL